MSEQIMTDGTCLGGVTQEGTMISNLPLLFADGYPTCLEKITVGQLEKFIPFMIQCSTGQGISNSNDVPEWWPTSILPFAIPLVKPPALEEKWLAILKSLVCRCYTFHGCEFMLRFCTELAQCPVPKLKFVDSWDGTTSLFNRDTGILLVKFRNENRSYDRKKDSPRKTLLPRGDTSKLVQPPLYDIYLCERCEGEFDTLKEVKDHEKMCTQVQEQSQVQDVPLALPIATASTEQEKFLNYVQLSRISNLESRRIEENCEIPRASRSCSLRYFNLIPFSSPLGMLLNKKPRIQPMSDENRLERIERYCCQFKDSQIRTRETRNTDDPWQITYRGSQNEEWTHTYKFPRRQWKGSSAADGLSSRSLKLLRRCRKLQVQIRRLTEQEIAYYTFRRSPSPCRTVLNDRVPTINESEFILSNDLMCHENVEDLNCIRKIDQNNAKDSIVIPSLGPNTLYVYDGGIVPAEQPNPQSLDRVIRVPVINLCSSDEEDSEEIVITHPECGVMLDTSSDREIVTSDQSDLSELCVESGDIGNCEGIESDGQCDISGLRIEDGEIVHIGDENCHMSELHIEGEDIGSESGVECDESPTPEQIIVAEQLFRTGIPPSFTDLLTSHVMHFLGEDHVAIISELHDHSVNEPRTTTPSNTNCHENIKRSSEITGLRNINYSQVSRMNMCTTHNFNEDEEESSINTIKPPLCAHFTRGYLTNDGGDVIPHSAVFERR